MGYYPEIYEGSCDGIIRREIEENTLSMSFLDPPFNQNKRYQEHDDNMSPEEYWDWMTEICGLIYKKTILGGSIYFMQREKNTEFVLRALRESGWIFQNLIIWKKMTSAVPQRNRYGKNYQIIAFGRKGSKSGKFNRVRYDALLAPHMKRKREKGLYCTDVWNDIRELTSGFFAGEEALRDVSSNKRLHEQQAPLALVLRMILSSTHPDDLILDPFSGTGTTNIVAMQLKRRSIAIEKDPDNVDLINKRLKEMREADDISKWRDYYRFTDNLDEIWPTKLKAE